MTTNVVQMDVVTAWQTVLRTEGPVPVDAARVIYEATKHTTMRNGELVIIACKLFGLYVSNGMIGSQISIKAARNMCHRLNGENEEK